MLAGLPCMCAKYILYIIYIYIYIYIYYIIYMHMHTVPAVVLFPTQLPPGLHFVAGNHVVGSGSGGLGMRLCRPAAALHACESAVDGPAITPCNACKHYLKV